MARRTYGKNLPRAAGVSPLVFASSSINVGTGGGYTTEGWINPLNIATQNPIFEWNDGATAGAHLWIAASVAGFGGPGSLYAPGSPGAKPKRQRPLHGNNAPKVDFSEQIRRRI